MGKKKSKSTKQDEKEPLKTEEVKEEEEEEEEEDGEVEEETELVYLQVDTGDIIKLKQILDETVANTFLEESVLDKLNGSSRISLGFKEDHALNNLKLVLMTVACAFAMVAQFAPLPFPESRFVLGGCCAAYFVLSGVLQLIVTFLDKDCILITKIMENVPSAVRAKNQHLEKYGLRVRTNMPRFSDLYTVIIEFEGLDKSPYVSKTWSVGKFFTHEGMFDEYGLELEVEELYKRFEAGKFDKQEEKAGKKLKTN